MFFFIQLVLIRWKTRITAWKPLNYYLSVGSIDDCVNAHFCNIVSDNLQRHEAYLPFVRSESLSDQISIKVSHTLLSIFSALHRSCKYTAIKGKYICFQSVLFYAIILLLSNRNPATGGGERYRHFNYLYHHCCGRCYLPSHLQMVRQT